MGLKTSPSAAFVIFIAIIVHKGFAALALGISLIEGHDPLRQIVRTVVLFSLMTPVGVLVGTLFSQVLESDWRNSSKACSTAWPRARSSTSPHSRCSPASSNRTSIA